MFAYVTAIKGVSFAVIFVHVDVKRIAFCSSTDPAF